MKSKGNAITVLYNDDNGTKFMVKKEMITAIKGNAVSTKIYFDGRSVRVPVPVDTLLDGQSPQKPLTTKRKRVKQN